MIIAAVQSLSPSKSPRYRYVDSVAGHLLSQLLSHFPLFSSSSSSLFSLQRFYLLLLLSLSFCLIVLPSHLPLLATFVVGHGGTWLCVRSCVIGHTHTHSHTNTVYQESNTVSVTAEKLTLLTLYDFSVSIIIFTFKNLIIIIYPQPNNPQLFYRLTRLIIQLLKIHFLSSAGVCLPIIRFCFVLTRLHCGWMAAEVLFCNQNQ